MFVAALSRLPSKDFVNFTQTQYLYVFAISLPYTNPHKYDHYTVSLAHHVIAGWFLKCRLSLRRDFVLYIIKGFTTNVQKPFEEIKRTDYSAINEDSSNRKRSSSLTERGAKHRERPTHNFNIKNDENADEIAYQFHMELADTCIDFLSRHTYSTCSALPKRSPQAQCLMANGQSLSWLIGHNIITITTSGCSSTTVRNGLCDRCTLVCKPSQSMKSADASNGATSPETTSLKSSGSELFKRYTKATLQHNAGQDSESSDYTSSNSSSTTPFSLQSTDQPSRFFRQPSNEARFSSSSGSLDALSRRGSNPDTSDNIADTISKHSSLGHPINLSPQQSVERIKQVCACQCSGWAEIQVRRPTGNMSWLMRIQNHITLDSFSSDVPLQDLINLLAPSFGGICNLPDIFTDEPNWNSNLNISSEQVAQQPTESNRRKSVSVELTESKKTEKIEEIKELTRIDIMVSKVFQLFGAITFTKT